MKVQRIANTDRALHSIDNFSCIAHLSLSSYKNIEILCNIFIVKLCLLFYWKFIYFHHFDEYAVVKHSNTSCVNWKSEFFCFVQVFFSSRKKKFCFLLKTRPRLLVFRSFRSICPRILNYGLQIGKKLTRKWSFLWFNCKIIVLKNKFSIWIIHFWKAYELLHNISQWKLMKMCL